MPKPIDILIEVGMNADGKRGIDYYTANVVNALAACDSKNRYTIFTYFFRDFDAKIARLPNPNRGNFEVVVRRVPERIVKPIEWGIHFPIIEKFLIPPKPYKIYHMLSGGSLPHLRTMKGIVTFFDLQVETMPDSPDAAPGVGKIADTFTYGVAKRADIIVATGTKTKENLMKYYGIPSKQIEIIHTGVNLGQFHPVEDPNSRERIRKKYSLPLRYIMTIGPYVPDWRTNADYVLEAFASLKNAGAAADCKLVFAGAVNDHVKRLLRKGEALGVRNDLFTPGFIDDEDLAGVYALSDAVVHPTSVEGFGYGIEVFACGVPFITSNLPGVLEAVGDCALTVPPQQTAPLADAIRKVIQDADLREEMRRKGLARAPNYSYERVAEKLVSLYERAADSP